MQSTPTFGAAASGDRPGRYVDWDTEPGNLVGRNPNTGPWNPHPRYPTFDTGAEISYQSPKGKTVIGAAETEVPAPEGLTRNFVAEQRARGAAMMRSQGGELTAEQALHLVGRFSGQAGTGPFEKLVREALVVLERRGNSE